MSDARVAELQAIVRGGAPGSLDLTKAVWELSEVAEGSDEVLTFLAETMCGINGSGKERALHSALAQKMYKLPIQPFLEVLRRGGWPGPAFQSLLVAAAIGNVESRNAIWSFYRAWISSAPDYSDPERAHWGRCKVYLTLAWETVIDRVMGQACPHFQIRDLLDLPDFEPVTPEQKSKFTELLWRWHSIKWPPKPGKRRKR